MGRRGEPWTTYEDEFLRESAGKKTAEEIGMILGRPKGGVHHRMKRLGLDGKPRGENHWNSKLSNTQAQMALALKDAGFTVNEIRDAAFNHVSLTTLVDLLAASTWRHI